LNLTSSRYAGNPKKWIRTKVQIKPTIENVKFENPVPRFRIVPSDAREVVLVFGYFSGSQPLQNPGFLRIYLKGFGSFEVNYCILSILQ
jgi:hypothetical protein